MDDKTRAEFLRHITARDMYLLNGLGKRLCILCDDEDYDLGAEEVAKLIVAACRQASRTCETCWCWLPPEAGNVGSCINFECHRRRGDTCSDWRSGPCKENADA